LVAQVFEQFTAFYQAVSKETGAALVSVEAHLRPFFDQLCWHVRRARNEEEASVQLHNWSIGTDLGVPRPEWAPGERLKLPVERAFSLKRAEPAVEFPAGRSLNRRPAHYCSL